MPHRSRAFPVPPQRQRGMALFLSLIMLILLALLGLVGMQVTAMQERMSLNYLRVNQSFQTTEALARSTEAAIVQALYDGQGTFIAKDETCRTDFDAKTWGDNPALALPANYTRRIDKCFSSSSAVLGRNVLRDTGNMYQISVAQSDRPGDGMARSVIDTVFIP